MWPVSPEFLAAIRRRDQHTSFIRPTFAAWWKPWRTCPTRRPHRCRLPRHHYGRHASYDGFNIRWFDTAKDGTP